jgi:hypothetical protein
VVIINGEIKTAFLEYMPVFLIIFGGLANVVALGLIYFYVEDYTDKIYELETGLYFLQANTANQSATCLAYSLEFMSKLNESNITSMIVELTDIRDGSRHGVVAVLFDYGRPYRIPWYYKVDRALILNPDTSDDVEPYPFQAMQKEGE